MARKGKDASASTEKVLKKSKFASIKNPVFMLAIALAICLVSAIGGQLVRSVGETVSIKDLRWETPSGLMQSAHLFIPDTATSKNPAPAIVVTHGWSDHSELQDSFFVEYSRRGYVVLAIDMYSHGDSEALAHDTWWSEENGANGTYDGVKMLASLPYVDAGQIGVTGHSNGAWSCNYAVLLDNEAPVQLISSVFLVNNDALYTDTVYSEDSRDGAKTNHFGSYIDGSDTNYANLYGTRDVGVVASQHDFLFHRVLQEDGTMTSPVDFIDQPMAQSFLYFGEDPSDLGKRDSYTIYTENIDGEDVLRAIYNPDLVHTMGFFSAQTVNSGVEFFQASLPAPNPIAPEDQIWKWKAVANAVGVVGLFMFFVYFILSMLNTKFFSGLKAQEQVLPMEVTRKGKAWFWGGLIVGGIFALVTYPIAFLVGVALRPDFAPQERPWTLALWSLVNALFTLLILFVNYRRYSKANGLDLRRSGAILSRDKLKKSILLGLLTAASVYMVVFITDYFFKVDYRIWILFDFRAFDADKLVAVLMILPMMVFFYIINSIATNTFNYIRIGKREWVNTLLVAVLNTLGPILFFAIMYGYFYATGLMPFDYLAWGASTVGGWLVSVTAVLPVAAVLSRIIYKATGNPYIHGIAFSTVISIMMCTNALTVLT